MNTLDDGGVDNDVGGKRLVVDGDIDIGRCMWHL